ncbi:PREDICTED: kunitz trypsin inhibitor 2-like [Ipomoea nil]|uniref:kunitz trypsin inhibitor 2-like n=1 Tax=Ipomoea nil TaxID=35883 RepID=UPI00090189E2|nr:PREDICTED: kunitz trypsin inhibitor 2-like [Ipomoea nil]
MHIPNTYKISSNLLFFKLKMEKVILLSFLVAFSIQLLCIEAQIISDPVRDISGEEVLTGTDYNIVPAAGDTEGGGGGLTLASGPNSTCPHLVVQSPDASSNGFAVQFSSINPAFNNVQIPIDHNIKFSAVTTCVTSTVWRLNSEEMSGQSIVTIGGEEGNPGRDTANNWFNVRRDGNAYKLNFCPIFCDDCSCGDLGILEVDGIRILAITNDKPLRVVFKKA